MADIPVMCFVISIIQFDSHLRESKCNPDVTNSPQWDKRLDNYMHTLWINRVKCSRINHMHITSRTYKDLQDTWTVEALSFKVI